MGLRGVLTKTQADAMQAHSKPVPDGTVPGLILVPGTKKGRGRWLLKFTSPLNGKRREMGLGAYPEISLANAREAAVEARKQIAQKIDPIETRRTQKNAQIAAKAKEKTFEEAAREYWVIKKDGWRNGKHQKQWIHTLERYVFPSIGKHQLSELKPLDFANALKPIWMDVPETAARVKQRCHEVMQSAFIHGISPGNPVQSIEHLLPKQPSVSERRRHHPAMPWKRLPHFVQEVLHSSQDMTRLALEFLILTAARSGEVRGAAWDEIDFENKIWTIPADRMKMKKPHRIPLSRRSMEILEYQKSKAQHPSLIFPSPRGLVASDMIFTTFLRRHAIETDTKGEIATAHGFRSSFRDWASENGYPRDHAERALAHAIQNKVESAYHRTDLLEARQKMMEEWALLVIGGGEKVKQ